MENPNSRLHLTAHSRASDLRKMGWDIVVSRKRNPRNPRKPFIIYTLAECY